jgi:hypothetical protein
MRWSGCKTCNDDADFIAVPAKLAGFSHGLPESFPKLQPPPTSRRNPATCREGPDTLPATRHTPT